MAEELFQYTEKLPDESTEAKEGALCGSCFRAVYRNGPWKSLGLITKEYAIRNGIPLMQVTVHSQDPANTVDRLRIACDRCGKPASVEG